MTELTALLTKALLSTTFGVSREQRYSADELRDALARASGSVSETRKVLSAQPEVDDISVESVAKCTTVALRRRRYRARTDQQPLALLQGSRQAQS